MKPYRDCACSVLAMLALSLVTFSGAAMAKQSPSDVGQWSSPYNLDQYLEEGAAYDDGLTAEIVHAALLPPPDRNDPAIRVLLACEPSQSCAGGVPVSGQKYGRTYLWKPSRPTLATAVEVPAAYPQTGTQDFFCGGHTFLADGSLLWPSGTNLVASCNPPDPDCDGIYGHEFAWRLVTSTVSPSWVQAGAMQFARWYPTVTLLHTGDAVVLGHQFCPNDGQAYKRDEYQAAGPGSWLQAKDNWEYESGCAPPVDLALMGDYPRMHLLSNGQLVHTNAIAIDSLTHQPITRPSRFLDIGEQPWSCQPFGSVNRRWKDGGTPASPRLGGGSVHLITWSGTPGQLGAFTEVIYTPGGSVAEPPVDTDACDGSNSVILVTVERLVNPTATEPIPTWSAAANMNGSRVNHNTVILLDGSILVVGGLGRQNGSGPCTARHAPELYQPEEVFGAPTPVWVEMAEQAMDRLYHSIAVLLPNGDVLSGGGYKFGDQPLNQTSHSVEVFSPPYMYRGVRPTIDVVSLAPADDKHYGETVEFDVLIVGGAELDRVALIRNGASTHAFDMDQRYVELRLAAFPVQLPNGKWHVTVRMPDDGFQAPPGFYMLTAVDTQQRPSPAEWIRLDQ